MFQSMHAYRWNDGRERIFCLFYNILLITHGKCIHLHFKISTGRSFISISKTIDQTFQFIKWIMHTQQQNVSLASMTKIDLQLFSVGICLRWPHFASSFSILASLCLFGQREMSFLCMNFHRMELARSSVN